MSACVKCATCVGCTVVDMATLRSVDDHPCHPPLRGVYRCAEGVQSVVMNCECLTVVCDGCPSAVDAVLEFVFHWVMTCDGLTRLFQLPVMRLYLDDPGSENKRKTEFNKASQGTPFQREATGPRTLRRRRSISPKRLPESF